MREDDIEDGVPGREQVECGKEEEPIVNTCKMFTLRVNFLAASLPRIPGYMVLFLFFGFAMSSTMTASFLHHVIRDRECTQS